MLVFLETMLNSLPLCPRLSPLNVVWEELPVVLNSACGCRGQTTWFCRPRVPTAALERSRGKETVDLLSPRVFPFPGACFSVTSLVTVCLETRRREELPVVCHLSVLLILQRQTLQLVLPPAGIVFGAQCPQQCGSAPPLTHRCSRGAVCTLLDEPLRSTCLHLFPSALSGLFRTESKRWRGTPHINTYLFLFCGLICLHTI